MNKNILSKENIEQEIADLIKTKEIYKKETAKMRTRLHRLRKLLDLCNQVDQSYKVMEPYKCVKDSK